MKRSKIYLYSLVWLVSLAGAFYLGRTGYPAAVAGMEREPSPVRAESPSEMPPIDSMPRSVFRGTSSTEVVRMNGVDEILDSPQRRDRAYEGSAEDGLQRLRAAMSETDPIRRLQGILAAVDLLNAGNVREIVDTLEAQPGQVDNRVLSMLVHRWASFDPEGALEFATRATGGRREIWLTTAALRSWAQHDHEAALTWVEERGHVSSIDPFLPGVLQGWASEDPLAAAEYALNMESNRVRARALWGVAQEMVGQDPGQISEWLAGLSQTGNQDAMLVALSRQMARENPAAAIQLLSEVDPDFSNEQALSQLVSGWAATSPEEASRWVISLEEESARQTGMVSLVQEWSRRDPVAAGQWLNQFPPDSTLDQPVAQYSLIVQRADPDGALSWASSILDSTLRTNTLAEIGSRWYVRDPEQARAGLERAGVSPGVWDEIRRRIPDLD